MALIRMAVVTLMLLLCLSAAFAETGPLRVCLVSGSFEYESDASLAALAQYLEKEYAVSCTLVRATGWTDLPGLEALDQCDAALFFTRRLRIEGEQLNRVKRYVESGRSFVAVRTASHGFQNWLEFDKQVLGGDYQGHYDAGPTHATHIPETVHGHPILDGVTEIRSRGSLYKNPKIADHVKVLMYGLTREANEPVAWTRERGKSRLFYTSLGAQSDFGDRTFLRMLANALFWVSGRSVERKPLPAVADVPKAPGSLKFSVRSQTPVSGAEGRWKETISSVELPVAETAILICDMWDKHWCRGASERVDALAARINPVVQAARDRGIQIINAPSETLFSYVDLPQVRRVAAAPAAPRPPLKEIQEPPLPIDDSDGGCDTEGDEVYLAWTRQHPLLDIGDADAISDSGEEIYNFLVQRGIRNILYMGVHVNMCVLGRSFGIRNMTRLGIRCFLVRDLTDAMYDPKDPPHVSHDEGTQLVIQHIEKYWCPSLTSEDLMTGLPR